MNIKQEDIQYFINQETSYSPQKTIRLSIFGTLIFGIPTAIFGVYSSITRVVMLPIIVALCIWAILLLKNPINQNKYNFYNGVYAVFVSLSCLLLAYKLYVSNNNHEVPLKITCLTLVVYFICIAISSSIIIRLIKKGYYKKQKKHMNIEVISSIIAVTGILCGKKILDPIDPILLDNIMVLVFILFAALCGCTGTLGILKYYLARKADEQ